MIPYRVYRYMISSHCHRLIGVFCACVTGLILHAQTGEDHRWKNLLATEAVGYAGSSALLSTVWYHDLRGFRFFNDGDEWLQLDKTGHFMAAYHLTYANRFFLQQYGLEAGRAKWYAAGVSTAFLLTVEVLDGFSPDYGFSVGDVAANLIGTAAGALRGGNLPVELRFSFKRSGMARYRPALLGNSVYEEVLKDYNGQTYWVSIFPMQEQQAWYRYIGISLGYGASGMTGARHSPLVNEAGNAIPRFPRSREWYLSLDIDWEALVPDQSPLKKWARLFSFIKIPFPGLMFRNGKWSAMWVAY